MSVQAANLNHLWGALLVDEFYRQGCSFFCVSPGSRSTPLTVAAARHPHIETQICIDERAAAFMALGYGRATGKPAVLLCTSGTAVANYLPAVVEASVDRVPMIVCSADRPPELLQTCANQTIQQTGILGDSVRWHTTLPCPSLEVPAVSILTTADQAFHQASRAPAGPVHLNCMFREPLAPTECPVPAPYLQPIEAWSQQSRPYTTYSANTLELSKDSLQALLYDIQQASKGLVVVGRLPSQMDVASIHSFCESLGWPVLADIGSGLRWGHATWPYMQAFDMLLRQPSWLESHRPDVILHLGGPLLSKWFLHLLKENRETRYIQIHSHPERMDPEHCVSWRLEADPGLCCERLKDQLPPRVESSWIESWRSIGQELRQSIALLMEPTELTASGSSNSPPLHEPAIAYFLSRQLPASHTLFLGNSMPIRDWDLFASGLHETITVGANRGASGIDGLIATAMGMVKGSGQSGTLVLGDLSLLHDLNSLFLLQQTQLPLTIVVNNNQGGGIFGFLPIAQFDDVFLSHFITPHTHTLAPIARSLGMQASTVSSISALREAYDRAVKSGRPRLIEVQTQRETNVDFYRTFERCVSDIVNDRWGLQPCESLMSEH